MPAPLPGVVIDTGGAGATVSVLSASGATPTLYSDAGGQTPTTNPVTVASRSTIFLPSPGPYLVNGQPITLESAQVATITTPPPAVNRLPVHTAHPALFNLGAGATFSLSASQIYFARSFGSGTISQIGLWVASGSGNMAVGVYSSAQSPNNMAGPSTRIATSATTPVPASAYTVVNLTAPVAVDTSCYLAVAADTALGIFGVGAALGSSGVGGLGTGFIFQGSGFPLPATAPIGMVGIRGAVPIMMGL